jgi:hypothetical protein
MDYGSTLKTQENPMTHASQTQAAPAKLVIASRESALAMWQAEHIRDQLLALYPKTEVSILGMTTQGDQILDVTLSKIGGKGLFVKELETALEEGRADIAYARRLHVVLHKQARRSTRCICFQSL